MGLRGETMTDNAQRAGTPITDAAVCKRVHTPNVWGFKEHDRVEEFVPADKMRTLERQLAEAQARVVSLENVIRMMRREMREATRDAASEAIWKERQGDEYGSY